MDVNTRRDELSELRAENERLRRELDAAHTPAGTVARSRGIGRTIAAVPLILIGALLAPVALGASWAANEVSDTDAFVASLSPLAADPGVRAFVAARVVSTIDDRIDIDTLTADAFDGVAELGIPPVAADALRRLAPAAADGLRSLLSTTVTKAVSSPAFQRVWDQTLALSHDQVVDILEDNRDAALVIDDTGEVGIQLAPLITRVKSQLEARNFPLADRIPVVDATVPIGTTEAITPLRSAYRLLLLLAGVLPWLSLLLLAVGVLLARSRPRALVGAGSGLVLATAALITGLLVARVLLMNAGANGGIPTGVTRILFDSLTTTVRAAGFAIILFGLTLAAVGALTGASPQARAVRSVVADAVASTHEAMERQHLIGRRFGAAVYAMRIAIRVVVVAVAVGLVVLLRPLTPGVVALVALACGLVIAAFAILEARPGAPDSAQTLNS
jgi:hypothetical protein